MYKGDRIMQETFKLFSTLREPALKDATNESLARLYQIKPSNAILAEAFCRNFNMLYLLQNILLHSVTIDTLYLLKTLVTA